MQSGLDDVVTFLEADTALSALIGTRIYPVRLPQAPDLPAITYAVISAERFHAFDGAMGIRRERVQFDAWSETYGQLISLADALRLRLDAYKGPAGTGEIQGAFFQTQRDMFEAAPEIYRRSMDYFIWLPEDT